MFRELLKESEVERRKSSVKHEECDLRARWHQVLWSVLPSGQTSEVFVLCFPSFQHTDNSKPYILDFFLPVIVCLEVCQVFRGQGSFACYYLKLLGPAVRELIIGRERVLKGISSLYWCPTENPSRFSSLCLSATRIETIPFKILPFFCTF